MISGPGLAALWAKGSVLGTCVTAFSLLAGKAWPAPKPWVHTRLLPCRVLWTHSHFHTPVFGCMLPHQPLCVEQWWGGGGISGSLGGPPLGHTVPNWDPRDYCLWGAQLLLSLYRLLSENWEPWCRAPRNVCSSLSLAFPFCWGSWKVLQGFC